MCNLQHIRPSVCPSVLQPRTLGLSALLIFFFKGTSHLLGGNFSARVAVLATGPAGLRGERELGQGRHQPPALLPALSRRRRRFTKPGDSRLSLNSQKHLAFSAWWRPKRDDTGSRFDFIVFPTEQCRSVGKITFISSFFSFSGLRDG